jgi:two-component system, chemotaxis family, chemotaxis protein CheY
MRALVIDDSTAAREIFAEILEEIGFEVFKASHGQDGLDMLQRMEKPDLVLVDWIMPYMNGIEFIRAMRSNRAYDGIRLMMVTSQTEMPQVARALEAGADEYVMKPATKDIILEKLNLLGISPAAP